MKPSLAGEVGARGARSVVIADSTVAHPVSTINNAVAEGGIDGEIEAE